MLGSETAPPHVLAGLTAAGEPLIERTSLAGEHSGQGMTSTNSSFHGTESFNKEHEISPVGDSIVGHLKTGIVSQNKSNEHEHSLSGEISWSKETRTYRSVQQNEQQQLSTMSVNEEKPVASSGQFERKRTASLAAALLSAEHTPGYKAIVQFVSPSGATKIIEACSEEQETLESDQTAEGTSVKQESLEAVIGRLLFTLSSLQMSNPDRHAAAVRRLQELEQELRAAGAVCPPDVTVSDAVAKALASASPNSDLQIRVNSSRRTTTTKSVFETETPGMSGLDPQTVQRLQQQLISNMS